MKKLVLFILIILLLSCYKDSEQDTNKPTVHSAEMYAVSEPTLPESLYNPSDTRAVDTDTFYVWYTNLCVLMTTGGTHQLQFEGVVSTTVKVIKDYYTIETNTGEIFKYDAKLLSIKVKSGRIYTKHVIEIYNTKGVEVTEIRQDTTTIFRSTGCVSQMKFTTRKVYTDESAVTYSLCRSGNFQSGRGARFLFINR
jgi:hypothetical protein